MSGCGEEGTAFDKDSGAYFVGATGNGAAAGGAIYRGTLDRRLVEEFIPGAPGKKATGMKVFRGKPHVAGGFSDAVTVYDIATKQVIARSRASARACSTTSWSQSTARSSSPTLPSHVVAHHAGANAAGGGAPTGSRVDPGISYVSDPHPFNLNGIGALRGGRSLVVGCWSGRRD